MKLVFLFVQDLTKTTKVIVQKKKQKTKYLLDMRPSKTNEKKERKT